MTHTKADLIYIILNLLLLCLCAFEKDHLGKISPSEDALLQQVPQLKGCFLEIYCSKYKRSFNVIFPYLTLESKFSNAWKPAVEYSSAFHRLGTDDVSAPVGTITFTSPFVKFHECCGNNRCYNIPVLQSIFS